MNRMNSGVKICGSELHTLTADYTFKGTFECADNSEHTIIPGRRNHAMSLRHSTVHLTGGIEANGKFLHDFWIYSTEDGKWKNLEVRQIKKSADVEEAFALARKDSILGKDP